MAWLYLILAGLFEMGWPLGFKLANLIRAIISFFWLWPSFRWA